MHIPSEMLQGGICPVTAGIATAGVAASAWLLYKGKAKVPAAGKFAMVSAAVFGLQMLNCTIWDGVSGHFIGGVFAAALLGVPAAVVSMSIVLLLQTLLFADGGILMLGANILNMAILGAGLGGVLRYFLLKKNFAEPAANAAAAFVAVELAAFALCAELALSGKGDIAVFSTLIGIHTWLALFEAGATAGALALIGEESKQNAQARPYLWLGTAIVGALALAPFASAFPDAFEWTMAKFSMLPEAQNFASAPFADYAIRGLSSEIASTVASAAIGLAATAALAYSFARGISRQRG